MSESIYEYVLSELELSKGNWEAVSTATGIPKRSIEKIARQEWKNPGIASIETLATYFRSRASMKTRRTQAA
jgi:saccharopine dehydrogenase-like NADP-dependent oxidoreductase